MFGAHLRTGYREVQARVMTEFFGPALYTYIHEEGMSIARCQVFEDNRWLTPQFYFDPHRAHDGQFWGMAPETNQGYWLRHLALTYQCFVGWGGVKHFRELGFTTHYFRESDGRSVPYMIAYIRD